MTRTIKTLLLASCAAVMFGTGPALADSTVRLISAWPETTSMVRIVANSFVDNVGEASGGTIKFVRNGPETVPPFDQLQPLSAGVFDIMFSTPAYHQADTGVGVVMDGLLTTDTALVRESGVFDKLDAYYRDRYGLTLLALVPAPPNQFLLRDPLGEAGTLDGRKIRSNAAFEGIVRGLGGAPVGLPPADIYPSLEKGVIDGTAAPQHAAADYRFYEVASYMTRPGFGHSALVLMANAANFDALPEEDRKIILEQAEALESSGAEGMSGVADEQNATMEANGVKIAEFPAAVADKLSALFAEGTTAVAMKSDPDGVQAILDFAKEKGALAE